MRAPWLVLILTEILNLVLGDAVCHRNDTDLSATGQRSGETLSRRRRYLTFPKGSSFVLTVSTLKAIQLHLPSNWYLTLEFDVIWPIPTEENFRKSLKRRPTKLKRRHKRELYANFEHALNSQNLPGRLCVLRAICESKSILNPPGFSFIEDAIAIVLSNLEEPGENDCYDVAYKMNIPCDVAYPCPFSILKLMLFSLYSNSPDRQ
ncbi:hypothetical protein KM043_007928 [Ampulex compressa]|nr:hypothetical protein KM043_007928 [Ampulex compressa]